MAQSVKCLPVNKQEELGLELQWWEIIKEDITVSASGRYPHTATQ